MRGTVRWAGWQALAMTVAFATAGFAAGGRVIGSVGASPDEIVLVQPVYEPQHTYGSAPTVQTVRIEDFFPPRNTVAFDTTINGMGVYRFQTTPSPTDWWGGLFLPSGAIVDGVEMEACDTTATGQVLFGLARHGAPAGPGGNVTPTGTTGVAQTPGCAFFSVAPTGGLTIDNRNASYTLYVNWGGNPTNETRVAALRVFYRLQVGAPSGVTFPNDVPVSHPYYRFIEALAASGITGGCAPGSYCPDAPLTRGQMAVFLSVALGLHFPN